MATSDVQTRLLSRPVPVEWAGWRTTTAELQQRGWEIAVDYDFARDLYQLLLRHRQMRLYAVTDVWHLDRRLSDPHAYDLHIPAFHVQGVAPTMEVFSVSLRPDANFQPIDATPCISTRRITRIEDMNIFNVPLTRTEEVFIDEADMTVLDHLQAIKDLQSEEQRRIRDRILREGSEPPGVKMGTGPELKVHANIVSLAATA